MAEEKNKNVKEALDRVDEIMQDPEIMDLYFNIAVSKWDYYSGMRQGEEKGIEQGREQGKKDAKIEMARFLLGDNKDVDYIIKATGLSKEEIAKIKQEL